MIKVGWVLAIALLIALTLRTVSLTPHVDATFFFGGDDPQLKEYRAVEEKFTRQEQIILNIDGDIRSPAYLDQIQRLTERLLEIPQVVTAKSLTHGPKNLEDALESEFWSRLLVPENGRSSNIFVVIESASVKQAIINIERTVKEFETRNFRPIIAGISYMIEMIQRRLLDDLKVFSFSAIGIFGLLVLLIFRSFSILVGYMGACATATCLTLFSVHYLGIGIGIVSANLVTIVFMLTMPHLIYFTYNWRENYSDRANSTRSVLQGLFETFPGSFWSMGTTVLGFLSLLLVDAKPIRQLGSSGAIGSVCALLAAYIVYPFFLVGIKPKKEWIVFDEDKRSRRFFLHRYSGQFSKWIAGGFVVSCLLVGIGLLRLDTDPSLLTYFPKSLRQGLERIDRNGGSSLMEIVLKNKDGQRLDNDESYERLWQLQYALERDDAVGTVISLPLLMAEGDRHPLSFLLSWKTILNKLAQPKYGRIARQYISPDFIQGHFVLRMKERNRSAPRAEVIERIKRTVRKHGFTPVLVGGIYSLQAQLAALVKSSLFEGLGEIVLLLGAIGLILARSLKVALTMAFGMTMVPVGLLGTIGLFKASFDVISAPAANLTLGMGIDDTMIHLVQRWRVLVKQGHSPDRAWELARSQLTKPILVSMLLVCLGFSIFLLSQFPPVRRFGLWVILGTFLIVPCTMYFLPTVGSWWRRVRIFSRIGALSQGKR